MTSKEIVQILKSKNRQPRQRAIKVMAIYMLGKRGYSKTHISIAFGMDYYTVQYILRTAEDLLEVNDKYLLEAQEVLKTHIIDLYPYFDRKTMKIKTYAKIDNIKL